MFVNFCLKSKYLDPEKETKLIVAPTKETPTTTKECSAKKQPKFRQTKASFKEFKLPLLKTRPGKAKEDSDDQTKMTLSFTSPPLMISSSRKELSSRKTKSKIASIEDDKSTNEEFSKDLKQFVLKNSSCFQKPLVYSSKLGQIPKSKLTKDHNYNYNSNQTLHCQLINAKDYLAFVNRRKESRDFPQTFNKNWQRKNYTGGFWEEHEFSGVIDVIYSELDDDYNWKGSDTETTQSPGWWRPPAPDINLNVKNERTLVNHWLKSVSSGKSDDKVFHNDKNISNKRKSNKNDGVKSPHLPAVQVRSGKLKSAVSVTHLEIPDEKSVERIVDHRQATWLPNVNIENIRSVSSLDEVGQTTEKKFSTSSVDGIGKKNGKKSTLSKVNLGKFLSISSSGECIRNTESDEQNQWDLLKIEAEFEIKKFERETSADETATKKAASAENFQFLEPLFEAVQDFDKLSSPLTPHNTEDAASTARTCTDCAQLLQKRDSSRVLEEDDAYKNIIKYLKMSDLPEETNQMLGKIHNSIEVLDASWKPSYKRPVKRKYPKSIKKLT